MADVLLFHHAHGLTDGVRAFADRLRADGHVVVVPDLYAGRVFSTVEEGVAQIPSVEAACKETFGVGMGPFELMNVTGLPIAIHAATTLGRSLGSFYAPPRLLRHVLGHGGAGRGLEVREPVRQRVAAPGERQHPDHQQDQAQIGQVRAASKAVW